MNRPLPDKINLLEYDWMRAQVLQYLLNPLARDGNLVLSSMLSPTHVRFPDGIVMEDIHIEQFKHLQSIRSVGYDSRLCKKTEYHELMGSKYSSDEILVEIDPTGELVLVDGVHRILYMLIAGYNNITARVRYRHPEWVKFVRSVDSISNGYTYCHLPHPDFDGCTVGRRETRIKLIYDKIIGIGVKSATDLGCCMGVFSTELSGIVDEVTGVDRSEQFIKVSSWLNKRRGNKVNFELGDAMTYEVKSDMTCLMSIIHHMIIANGLSKVLERLRDIGNTSRFLLTEIAESNEPILSNSQESRIFADERSSMLELAGWYAMHDFGVDTGFGSVKRKVQLWCHKGEDI